MATPSDTSQDRASDVEMERRINDLWRERLDNRSKYLDRWLVVVAIFLTFLAIIIPVVVTVVGFLSFERFRKIEAEAYANVEGSRTHTEKAEKLAGEIAAEARENVERSREYAEEARAHAEEARKLTDDVAVAAHANVERSRTYTEEA